MMRKLRELLTKKVSLMVVGNSQDRLRQLKISYSLILGVIFIIVFLISSNIILTTNYVNTQVTINEADRLAMENKHLTSKFDKLKGEVAEISSRYSTLVEKEIQIRNIFNLPEISGDERQLGIGGPDNIEMDKLSTALRVAHTTETDVDALLRLSTFELEKYEEVFGELQNKKDLLDHTPSICPSRGHYTRGFGMKHDPFTGYKRFHGGIDIANKYGTPIYSSADGVIQATGRMSDLGKYVIIDHGYGYKTKYGHLKEIKVKRGQKVRRGDLVALMGNTGYSTGPHLHYEVIKHGQRVNPQQYILN